MAETKRYDVSGMDRGDGRRYPDGSILKLTEDQAKKMGLSEKNVSKVSTTADDRAKARSYEDAMTSQDRMRERETDGDTTAAARTRKRTAANK